MSKINKTSESRHFVELDGFGNKLIDTQGMKKRKDSWTTPETLRRIIEKDNIL